MSDFEFKTAPITEAKIETDPFQQLADEAAAAEERELMHAASLENAVKEERVRCQLAVQSAIDQASMRGLSEQSPVVRILSAIRGEIENG